MYFFARGLKAGMDTAKIAMPGSMTVQNSGFVVAPYANVSVTRGCGGIIPYMSGLAC